MKRSTERMLTTHTGSLPRPADLLRAMSDGRPGDAALRSQVRSAVRDAVRRQVEAGIDVVSDGEMGKVGFANYVSDRMTGFGGESTAAFAPRDLVEYPEVMQYRATGGQAEAMQRFRRMLPGNDADIRYAGRAQLEADLDNFRAALEGVEVQEAFLPAASPGCVVQIMGSTYYPSRRAYLYALADALREEYRAIVDAGFVLQVDCPDLAMGRHLEFPDATLEEFRENLHLHVEALNHGLAGIDPERVRVHVCWGNYVGPHHRDVALRDILDAVYEVNAHGISIEAANPRHEHEWTVFAEQPLPEGRYLIPGVVDSCTNYIEHPDLVAQRIVRFAQVVGRENVIAGTDCGFSTFAGVSAVAPTVAYAKLVNLAEGARIATAELWGGQVP